MKVSLVFYLEARSPFGLVLKGDSERKARTILNPSPDFDTYLLYSFQQPSKWTKSFPKRVAVFQNPCVSFHDSWREGTPQLRFMI